MDIYKNSKIPVFERYSFTKLQTAEERKEYESINRNSYRLIGNEYKPKFGDVGIHPIPMFSIPVLKKKSSIPSVRVENISNLSSKIKLVQSGPGPSGNKLGR